jgi:hypothetical protein
MAFDLPTLGFRSADPWLSICGAGEAGDQGFGDAGHRTLIKG